MEKAQYSQVEKYVIYAICKEPLHVGSANGDREEVLTHPVDQTPFIQASSLAGVFRNYFCQIYGTEETEQIFGKSNSSEEFEETKQGSRIRFTDGNFRIETVKIELRPRLKLNSATGTVDVQKNKGTEQHSGQKFDMQYVAAGAEISFTVYFFGKEKEQSFHEKFLMCLSAIQNGSLQFGGQKRNGCGYLKLLQVFYQHYNLKEEIGRKKWFQEYKEKENTYQKIDLSALPLAKGNRAFEIQLYGKVETELLIKGIAVTDCGDYAPDTMNLQNGKKDYIIPASSLKGTIRNRIEMIQRYKQIDLKQIESLFGRAASEDEEGITGLFCFYDTIIGEKEENEKADIRMRIRIDKFTGGARNGGLFSQKNTTGKVTMRFGILEGEQAVQACALLIYALRDLANGEVTVGSGYSIGKGFIQTDQITITNSKGEICIMDFQKGTIQDKHRILSTCLQSLEK